MLCDNAPMRRSGIVWARLRGESTPTVRNSDLRTAPHSRMRTWRGEVCPCPVPESCRCPVDEGRTTWSGSQPRDSERSRAIWALRWRQRARILAWNRGDWPESGRNLSLRPAGPLPVLPRNRGKYAEDRAAQNPITSILTGTKAPRWCWRQALAAFPYTRPGRYRARQKLREVTLEIAERRCVKPLE